MRRIDEEQVYRNEQSRLAWDLFAEHRRHIAALLRPAMPGGRLLLLGAGNCNDVELAKQLVAYDQLTLADIDQAALQQALQRQNCEHRSNITLQSYDASGLLPQLHSWHGTAPTVEAVHKALGGLPGIVPPWPMCSFTTSVSLCLLSQLIDSLQLALGMSHPQLIEAITAVRQYHLRTLINSTAPGGRAILVIDFVSSLTLPELDYCAPEDLSRLAHQALNAGNFFSGSNPQAIMHAAKQIETVGGRISNIEATRPWRWNLGPRRYLACAIVFQIRTGNVTSHTNKQGSGGSP